MIIVELRGGLGNQLFQYAFAKTLALRHNTELKIDTRFMFQDKPADFTRRALQLDIFQDKLVQAEVKDCQRLTKGLGAAMARRLPYRWRTYLVETKAQYFPGIEQLPATVYLDGYWQSPRYFEKYAQVIRQALQFRKPPAGKNEELLAQLKACNSVAVHFRRTDYLAEGSSISASNYYERARKLILAKVKDPVFYVFSDDPQWVKQNVAWPNLQIVEENTGENSWEDLRLMSNCRHNIIANSTFSWWGAWLNAHPNKVVIAPLAILKNNRDILPTEWLVL